MFVAHLNVFVRAETVDARDAANALALLGLDAAAARGRAAAEGAPVGPL